MKILKLLKNLVDWKILRRKVKNKKLEKKIEKKEKL